MKRPLCAICDATNQTLRLCAECRQDSSNEGWSQGDALSPEMLLSADTEVDATNIATGSVFDLMGRRARKVTLPRQMALGLLYHFTIRVAYRNRKAGRGHRPWIWRSRPLNLSEVAWLIGKSRQSVVKGIRFELEIKQR